MVRGLGCAAWGLRFRVLGVGVLDFGSGVWYLVFGVWCLGFTLAAGSLPNVTVIWTDGLGSGCGVRVWGCSGIEQH